MNFEVNDYNNFEILKKYNYKNYKSDIKRKFIKKVL